MTSPPAQHSSRWSSLLREHPVSLLLMTWLANFSAALHLLRPWCQIFYGNHRHNWEGWAPVPPRSRRERVVRSSRYSTISSPGTPSTRSDTPLQC